MSTPRHALPSTPRTPPKRQRSEFSEELPSTWEATCEWVLTKRVSLWDMLLEPILLQVLPNRSWAYIFPFSSLPI